MITLRDFMEIVDYRITEGADYNWNCFGPTAYDLSYWNGDNDGHSVSVVFDRQTQIVYSMEAADYQNQRGYRWINPDYKEAHSKEMRLRGIDDLAWDDRPWTDLDVAEDFVRKASAIVRGEKYDTRVEVPLELEDNELFRLMKMAHEKDITLNQMVEQILARAIENEKSKVDTEIK